MFYHYSQNNSGGVFCEPAGEVIVEADSRDEANDIAVEYGVYFNGCATGYDCSCCGDRWYEPWEDEGTDKPEIYGEDPRKNDFYSGIERDGIVNCMIIYKNGLIEKF